MTQTFGRNERCPCGSGLKVKKCCKLTPTVTAFTEHDRAALLRAVDEFIGEHLGAQEEQSYLEFWGAHHGREAELDPDVLDLSHAVQLTWFLSDYELAPGRTVLDVVCERQPQLSLGARAYAQALRGSSLRVYEVMQTEPGTSITLMDVAHNSTVTVAEAVGSTIVQPSEWLAARVLAPAASGKPEVELGAFPVPPFYRGQVFTKLADIESECQVGEDPWSHPDLPPFIHGLWVSSMLEPLAPPTSASDADALLVTGEEQAGPRLRLIRTA